MINTKNLGGTWQVRWSDGQRGRTSYAERWETDPMRYIPAQVPGEIHLDLQRAGWIADPYIGTNCLSARWVEECQWSYRRFFNVPLRAIKARAWLHFERLDLCATVILNGQEVGRHNNSFYPCRIDVTGKLKPGRNLLTVHVEGGLYSVSDKPCEGWLGGDALLHKRHWLRKPQCQFGWDWSTRLINVGITGSVSLEWTTDAARVDMLVPLVELSRDLRKGHVRARLFVEGLSDSPEQGVIEAVLKEVRIKAEKVVEIRPGLHPYELVLDVPNPALWWPAGHGSQPLYTLDVALFIGGRRIGSRSAPIGFRYVHVNQDDHPSGGRYFNIEINGKKIFAKGGNFVPADMIFVRCDRQKYDKLTDLALEANFNILRVWGGGLYESDDFYELCDQKGILVWQEFIFACAKYPVSDQLFYDSVKAEAVYNIRRLARHPSLIIWCGNNELEWGAWSWGYDKGVVYPDHALFHLTLPRLLAEEDPTRYYQPSSPWSPDGRHPNADDVGDQHPWTVGMHNTDFRDYRKMTCRFPNEGGTLGPTALPTMLACLPEGQRYVQSFAWQVHDNSVDSWAEPSPPDKMIEQWLGLDPRKMTIEEFVFWGGVVQGEALREYCENFRRRMFDTGSAIFWMYNDCWPATRSWTIVDYYLRRTPAFYPVRRAMQPLHLVLADEGQTVGIYGINETSNEWTGTLRFGFMNLAGGFPSDRTCNAGIPANASVRLAELSRSDWPDTRSSAAFGMLLDSGGNVVTRNRLFLPLFKEIRWPEARLNVRASNGKAVFSSKAFVWNVCIDVDGSERLDDNFFDVYPGIPHVITWKGPRPPRVLFTGNALSSLRRR